MLRSSIREFLCSEAMFHLGVPTTRAGACVTSQSTVVRDMFYDGNPKHEPCAVVLRIASTFLRYRSCRRAALGHRSPEPGCAARPGPCGRQMRWVTERQQQMSAAGPQAPEAPGRGAGLGRLGEGPSKQGSGKGQGSRGFRGPPMHLGRPELHQN